MSTVFKVRPTVPSGSKTISYSQFALYNECPWKWKLMYVDKHKPETQNIHLTFGTAMHETIQHYLTIAFEQTAKEADRMDLSDYLYQRLKENYKLNLEKNKGIPFTTRMEMDEFYRDGVEILEFIRKKRTEYFPTKNYKLLGMEVPLLEKVGDYNVYLMGFIDMVILDERDNKITVYDFKTSTRGWGDKEKKDENKKAQIIIYKEFFSKQYDIPIDNIDVVFFILKRKLWEKTDFAQKRVQTFTPASGKVTRKKVLEKLFEFVDKAFTKDGKYREDADHYPIAGDMDKNCKYCPFKLNHELCPPDKRLYY